MHKSSSKSILMLVAAAMLLAPVIAQPRAEALEPMIGQIQVFGFNFAPRGWAKCDGQLLAIAQNNALFSLLGTMYGGDGRTTFGLPDLRGRVARHVGNGPGLSPIKIGQKLGREKVTLAVTNLPSHTHAAKAATRASSGAGNQHVPKNHILAVNQNAYSDKAPDVTMKPSIAIKVGNTGGGQAFDIRGPSLGLLHCIALVGVFPSRN